MCKYCSQGSRPCFMAKRQRTMFWPQHTQPGWGNTSAQGQAQSIMSNTAASHNQLDSSQDPPNSPRTGVSLGSWLGQLPLTITPTVQSSPVSLAQTNHSTKEQPWAHSSTAPQVYSCTVVPTTNQTLSTAVALTLRHRPVWFQLQAQ